jgi:Cu+-exporting ATPase
MKKETFVIKGMHCASCANTIEKALLKVEGVRSAVVNFAAEKVTVEWDEKDVGVEKMVEMVKKVGYELVTDGRLIAEGTERTEGTEILRLKVLGMESGHCAMIVEQAVKSLPGIKSMEADFPNQRAKVVYETDKTTPEAIQQVIREAGYKPVVEVRSEKGEVGEDIEKQQREKEVSILKKKIILGALISIPVFLGSYPQWFPFVNMIPISWRYFLLFLLTIPVQFWAGWQFYSGLRLLIKYRTADMNTLIVIGTLAAFLYSSVVVFSQITNYQLLITPEVYFDVSTIIITLILLGRFLELRAKGQASEAIKKLIGLQPKEATVLLREGDERLKEN